MKSKFLLIAFLLVVMAILVVGARNVPVREGRETTFAKSPLDATYIIDGKPVTLVNGTSEVQAVPESASKITTRYFGNDVSLDLDADGREDKVFLLTRETGGSGVFFYVAAALNTENGYVGSQALFLGDRIAPQTTEVSRDPSHKNVIVVNYADRAPGEPMTALPSVGKSIWLKLDPLTMQFGEVVQGFEGEADPSRMKLDMQKWTWISTVYNNDMTSIPKKEKAFTITFKDDGTFSATTDCNGVGGNYTVKGNQISFGEMMSTLMYCEGSQESEFTKMLGEVQGYHFTSKGELVLDLKFDSGSFIFR
jgi:heat shock protein HslJ